MKKFLLLAFAILLFVSCYQNVPDDTKKGGDTTSLHQPENPATWSPVGHKYVSVDSSYYGKYLEREITFISKDSFLWKREDRQKVYYYEVNYPRFFQYDEKLEWLKFIDTLTIYRNSDMLPDAKCYKLVY